MKSTLGPSIPPSVQVEPSQARHQFRVVGGLDAAKEAIPSGMPHTINEVAVIASGKGTFHVTPISDIPLDGSNVKEEGYNAQQLKARVENYLSHDAYISTDLWLSVQLALESGAKVVFELSAAEIEVEGKLRRVVTRRGRQRA